MSMSGLQLVFMTARPALVRFLAARGVPLDEAEDIAQELYIKLDTQPIGPVTEPRAYLYRMANNLLLDRRRAALRRARRDELWCGARGGGLLDFDDRPSAEDVLIGRERLQTVTGALATLPDRTVEAFRRFRIDGVSQKAIAADLGISVSAVEKHLQRAYHVVIAARQRLDAELTVP